MKYRNRKTTVDGTTFDSKLEARRYQELKLMERAHEIEGLRTQVKYELIPAQKLDNILVERPCNYVADFVYTDLRSGEKIVEDTKGMKTKDYIIKRKLMLYVYGIRIREIN